MKEEQTGVFIVSRLLHQHNQLPNDMGFSVMPCPVVLVMYMFDVAFQCKSIVWGQEVYILYFMKKNIQILVPDVCKTEVYPDCMLTALFCAFLNKWWRFYVSFLLMWLAIVSSVYCSDQHKHKFMTPEVELHPCSLVLTASELLVFASVSLVAFCLWVKRICRFL